MPLCAKLGCVDLLRLGQAAQYLGVHPITLRKWANQGRIPCERVGGHPSGPERRFHRADLDRFMGKQTPGRTQRREALYVRVSGSTGQESSLEAQERELRGSSTGLVIAVYKDRVSGLREQRRGLDKLLADVHAGRVDVVRVTHQDRLARFGVGWVRQLLERDQVTLEVLHAKGNPGGQEELLQDFMALVATFAGRMYGIRSRESQRRLLDKASRQPAETVC